MSNVAENLLSGSFERRNAKNGEQTSYPELVHFCFGVWRGEMECWCNPELLPLTLTLLRRNEYRGTVDEARGESG